MSETVQFILRLPKSLKEKIADTAKENGRSANAEVQKIIENALEAKTGASQAQKHVITNSLIASSENIRLKNISKSLNFLLVEIDCIQAIKAPTIPRIASHMGFEYAQNVSHWFEGIIEPSFDELGKLADYLGCERKWLQFEELSPFEPKQFEFEYSIKKNVDNLLDNHTITGQALRRVYFVRKDSKEGELLIIKQFGDWSAKVYDTRIHVSNIVGDTGKKYRALLSLTLHYLCKHNKTKTQSMIVKDSDYKRLVSGNENPLKIIKNCHPILWIEDIWNVSMYSEQEPDLYWEDWRYMCEENARYISQDEALTKVQQDIERGTYTG